VDVTTPGKRPFWMHQAVEYLIGAAFVASGLQSPEPIVPTLMGGLIMINTACSKGPLAAFRVIGKRLHRLLDAALVLLSFAAAAQPFVAIDQGTRLIMAVLAAGLAVIWFQSDFAEHPKKPGRFARAVSPSPGGASGRGAAGDASIRQPTPSRLPDGTTADTIGRTAGRLAGKGVNLYRARKAANSQKGQR